MTSPLENLCGPGKSLRKEAPDAKEFVGLERSGLKRLSDADLRNRGEYAGDLYVDERLVTDLINACKIVAAAVHKLPPVT